jgi:cell division protein FtsI (penicillin-binding protein 3)
MTNTKQILKRFYIVVGIFMLLPLFVGFKLVEIQFLEGDVYRDMAETQVYRKFTIEPNRGNIYDVNMNLLATSVPKYEIRFDAVTATDEDFKENLTPLAKDLSKFLGQSVTYYQNKLRKARTSKNRYVFIAKNLDYSEYMKIREFPLFNKGAYKGGFIAEQETEREHPLGKVGERTVGYGNVGLEGAFNDYLKGQKGQRTKQKIAKGQWKPINDLYEIEPKDGYDVITTIDINIQDIAHHALLEALERFEADHGSVVVMETKTGEVKAIANLGRSATSGKYYEKINYAVYESHEPGSTFKLMSLAAALEDRVVDTTTMIDTKGGEIKYFDRVVKDSRIGGYGEINVAKAFEVSSNTAFSQMIYNNYKDKPELFVNRLMNMGLGEKLGLEIKGEGRPNIPHPDDSNWYGTTLPWLSFGYGVSLTPLQTLTFYNAIANDGLKVKPKFIKEVRDKNLLVHDFSEVVYQGSVCSKETAKALQQLMENTVKRGTATNIFSENYTMAGKTGTCQTEYWIKSGGNKYISSFAGYFPADEPKYSCIVVINKPNPQKGYYGSTVAAPVFQKIAQKIYKDTPVIDVVEPMDKAYANEDFQAYFELSQNNKNTMPNLKGMAAMDAIALLENMGLRVQIQGEGKVKEQSIPIGNKVEVNQIVNLFLS